jgi:hypothetical protein
LGEEEEDAIRIKHLVAAVCNGTDDSNSIVAPIACPWSMVLSGYSGVFYP